MFVDNEYLDKRYHGYTPEFYRRAQKRRQQEAARRVERERLAAERAAEEAEHARLAQSQAEQQVASLIAQYRELEITRGKKSVRQIILETAIKHGVRTDDILGASRSRAIIPARHEAMWRARYERPDLSLPAIGRVFGRDHTTIMAAVRKIDRQRSGN